MRVSFGLLAVLVCAGGVFAAPVLGRQDLRRLIVMEDRSMAAVSAEQVEWLGPGGMVSGGWHRWPDQPALLTVDAPAVLPQLFSPLHFFPRFALSPDGLRLSCWQRVGEGVVGQTQLTTVDLVTGAVTGMGAPQVFLSGGKLVSVGSGVVIAACQAEGGGTLLFRAEGDACDLLARFDGVVCEDLLAEADGDHVLVSCAGDPPRCYRVNWRAGVWAEVDSARYETARVDGLPASVLFDAPTGRLMRVMTDGERVVLAEGVQSACARAGAIVYAAAGGLWVTDAGGEVRRRLWGARGESGAVASLLSWSPEGMYVCHCYRSGELGVVRRAALGTETVKVRMSFPAGSVVKEGASIWLAERFEFDARGRVTGPVWGTLKALLRVEQVIPADAGVVAVAESVGAEGGVVERLTGANDALGGRASAGHITIGAGAQPPTAWMQTFTSEPLAGIRGWAEGDAQIGRPLSVVVVRRRLMPLQ